MRAGSSSPGTRRSGEKRARSTPRSQRAIRSAGMPSAASRSSARGRGREHDVALAVEGGQGEVACAKLQLRVARAQPGVGGQLRVVRAGGRQPEQPAGQRGGDPGRAGRAQVQQVVAALRRAPRRPPGGSARRPSARRSRAPRPPPPRAAAGRRAASVPITSTSKPGTPRSRISSSVRVTPWVAPMPSATSATRSGSPLARGELVLLAALERGRGRVGDRGDAGLEDRARRRPPSRRASPPRGGARARARPPPAACARGSGARAGTRSAWLKPSACRYASSSRSGRSRSIAASQARSSARASSGPMSAASAPARRVAVGHHALDHPQHDARVGRRARRRRRRARAPRSPSRRAPTWRRSPGRRAPRRGRRAGARGTRPGVAAGGACGPRAPDVDAGVVVGAADADAAVRVDVDRGRAVELGRARAVADLPDVEQLGEPAPVARRSAAPRRRRTGGRARTRSRCSCRYSATTSTSSAWACSQSWSSGVMPRQSTCTACGSPAKRAVSSSETNTSGRSAIASTPSIVSWSVIVTKSMPRRLASA